MEKFKLVRRGDKVAYGYSNHGESAAWAAGRWELALEWVRLAASVHPDSNLKLSEAGKYYKLSMTIKVRRRNGEMVPAARPLVEPEIKVDTYTPALMLAAWLMRRLELDTKEASEDRWYVITRGLGGLTGFRHIQVTTERIAELYGKERVEA